MKILFISHEASLTGAPLVLLNLLKWLKKNRLDVESHLVHISNGPRWMDFEREVKSVWLHPVSKKKYTKLFYLIKAFLLKINTKIYTERERYENKISVLSPDIIYCNSIICTSEGVRLKKASLNSKLVLHVHELPVIISLQQPDFRNCISFIDGFIAASELVKKSLITFFGVSEDKIQVVHEFVEKLEVIPSKSRLSKSFKIGASGLVHWRKGYDVFIMIANQFRNKYPQENVLFEWVGKIDDQHEKIVDADLDKLGLTDIVKFVGETMEPMERFNDFDLFLMVSREDPFPLVCIEVAQLGKPIICFEKASGSVEMLSNGGGKVVPYFDVSATVDAIYAYMKDEALYNRDSEIIREEAKKYMTDVQAPKVYDYLSKVLND